MKHLKLFFALFAMLALGVGNAWAETATLSFTAKCNGKGTDTQENKWTITSDGTESTFDNTKGIHYGTNSAKVQYIRLSTSDIPGTITEVKVNASTASSVTAYLTVKVGSSDFTTGNSVTSQKLSTSATEYTFSGSASGEIIVEISKSSSATKAIYCKSVVVTYETSGGGSEEQVASLTANPTTIDFGTKNIHFESEKQGSLEIQVTGQNLTGNVTAAISGNDATNFKLSSSSLTHNAGSVSEKLTVSYEVSEVKDYTATLTLSSDGVKAIELPITLKVINEEPATYVKVTNAVTDGDYLIVYEEGNVAFNGALTTLDAISNTVAVEINNNTIVGNTEIDAATFTIASMTGGHSIQSKSGKYIGRTSGSNGMNTGSSAIANVITFSNGAVKVAGSGSGSSTSLQYNATSGQTRFRYFTTTQKAIALYKKVDPNAVVEPQFKLAAGEYYGTQSVEITCATTGAEIYYTLNGTDPTSASTKYTGAISIASTTTVKAIAVKGANSSAVVSATYTILAPLATMQEIFEKATDATQSVHIKFNDWVISGVVPGKDEKPSSNAYITDGSKGFIIYTKDGHGFNVGDKLSGTVVCDLTRYNGSAEVVGLTSSTTGLTVTTGGTVTPVVVNDVTTLSGVNTGAVVKITGTCTQESSKYYVAGVQLYNSLFTYTNPTVGKKYNVTGVYLQYNTTQEILPRQQEDIEEIVDALPSATISIADITMEIGQEKTIEATITPDAAKTTVQYAITSGNEYITLDGTTITAVAAGEATITATIAEVAGVYNGATKTFTVTVKPQNIAVLPFTFDGGRDDIEATLGMSQDGLGSDYTSAGSPKLKFDHTGDCVIIHFNGEPGKLSYDIKGNSYSGGTFTVQESENGETYTDIVAYTELSDKATKTHTLTATSRYVKFIYTNKSAGNVALGNIKIALPEEEPGEGGGETPEERLTDWVLTPLADITTNDLVVITMTKGETTWAMTNNNGTSAAPVASVVTLSADALAAEPDANLKWVVSNDNGTLTIYPYGTYETWLYCTNTNNGVRVGTGDAKEFTIDTDHLYTTLTEEPRYLGVYDSDADTWRCYTSINSNIEGQTLAFYVKKNANDVLPGTGEDPEGGEGGEDPVVPTPTINPTATFIFNTADGLTKLGITYPATADEDTEGAFKTEFENNATFTQDGITMTTTGGTVVATRVWLTKNGALDLRVYKGATLTFSVPAEHKISAIVFDGSNIGHLLVNGTAVSGNAWTGSAQTITFTAKADAKTIKINTIAFVVEYTRNVTNKYGTICLPYASASTSGAYFYEVVGKGTENGKDAVYLASVNSLKAGVPYIFEKTANTIKVVYSSEKVDAPQNDDANGLVGTFTEITVPNDAYILHNNAFCTNNDPSNPNKIKENRAYLNMANVEGDAPQQMPGRRYIGMGVQGENSETGFENITAPAGKTVKAIVNGQLIIIRDGEMYNAQGQRL